MTTRLAMAVAFLLVLLAQAWGLVSVLRDDPLRNLAVKGKKEAKTQGAMPGKNLSMQPMVSGDPPDLNQGYIFSAERNLAAGGGKDGQSQNAGNVAIDKIHYSGSIITDANPRALLTYPLGGGQPGASDGGRAGTQTQGFLRVAVGDTVNGYKVTEILSEKITFSRGGQKITKLLYDKTKERQQVQPITPVREPSAQAHLASPGLQTKERGQAQPSTSTPPVVREPSAQIPAPPGFQAPRQNDPRILAPRKPIQSPPPPPSDEELRQRPLRKRPEPPT